MEFLTDYMIPLVGSYLTHDMFELAIMPVFALGFISLIPDFIRRFIEWR